MPETSQGQTSSNPSTTTSPKRSRPPGEMGGHTVMPWEQDGSTQVASHIPAGGDATTTASGGSSKSVPPPASGKGRDGLGQGAGASTVKEADANLPAAESRDVSGKPPQGSAGAPAKPNAYAKPQDLETRHPEGAEPGARRSPPKESLAVERDDAPEDAMAGAPPTAFKATPQASKDAPEDQIKGGDETKPSRGSLGGPDTKTAPAKPEAKKPVTPTAAGAPTKPSPGAVDQVAKASVPNRVLPATGADAAKAASGAPVHPTNPAMAATSGQHDPRQDALIETLDKRLAEMLARALHETVATAVHETLTSQRPAAPPPVQPAKKGVT